MKDALVLLASLALTFGMLAVFFVAVPAPTPPEPVVVETDASYNTTAQLYDVCKRLVLTVLKAPSTAEFPSLDRYRFVEYKDGGYGAEAFVDSQNGFGAMLRSDWDCRLMPAGPGAWRVVSLRVGDTTF